MRDKFILEKLVDTVIPLATVTTVTVLIPISPLPPPSLFSHIDTT
jgi:hypothetical protein